jgi:hypothetical protein
LIETGDKVVQIEGILSGTLSYIFNTFKPGVPFSSVVSDAAAKGFTEPDPREDLSGRERKGSSGSGSEGVAGFVKELRGQMRIWAEGKWNVVEITRTCRLCE